jgi:hypothetical protein
LLQKISSRIVPAAGFTNGPFPSFILVLHTYVHEKLGGFYRDLNSFVSGVIEGPAKRRQFISPVISKFCSGNFSAGCLFLFCRNTAFPGKHALLPAFYPAGFKQPITS